MQVGEVPGSSLPCYPESGSLHLISGHTGQCWLEACWWRGVVELGTCVGYVVARMGREQECRRENRLQAPRLAQTGMELGRLVS